MFLDTWGWASHDAAPMWVPQVQTIAVPCGRYFDAVRADADIAVGAHKILGPGCGPVLANSDTRAWFFLLEPGAMEPGSWRVRGSRLLRPGTLIAIPPAFITNGRDVRWVALPGRGTTCPHDLRDALDGRTPPSPVPRQRSRRAALPLR
ncbi:hypothetical protein [Streptomyces decoyicus]|uniref:hypothetical protein n=1 Tax=Streptomyces decoyicus TaxID=249567 RepID=UPI0036542A7D